MLHSPYETIFYYIKPIYIVPFTGVFLILLNKFTFSFFNVLRKLINLTFFFTKKTLNRAKTIVKYSKLKNIKNIPIPEYLRNLRVYMVDNINTDNSNINYPTSVSNQTIYTISVIDSILRANQHNIVNTTPNPLVNLDRRIEQLNTNIMNLIGNITRMGGAWTSYVRLVQENHQVRIYQDRYSNTRYDWPANIAQNIQEQIIRVVNTQTPHYIALFPDLAEMVADLYFSLWLIRQSDPNYEFFEECIIAQIYPLINNTEGMYFVGDFNECLYRRLYQLIYPNPQPESKSKRRLSDDSDSGYKPSKKRRDGFDDTGNSFCS